MQQIKFVMGKRKLEDNVKENCDEWLSTRNRKKVCPTTSVKKRHHFASKTVSTSNNRLTQNSPPPPELKTFTKQSKLHKFFPQGQDESAAVKRMKEECRRDETVITGLDDLHQMSDHEHLHTGHQRLDSGHQQVDNNNLQLDRDHQILESCDQGWNSCHLGLKSGHPGLDSGNGEWESGHQGLDSDHEGYIYQPSSQSCTQGSESSLNGRKKSGYTYHKQLTDFFSEKENPSSNEPTSSQIIQLDSSSASEKSNPRLKGKGSALTSSQIICLGSSYGSEFAPSQDNKLSQLEAFIKLSSSNENDFCGEKNENYVNNELDSKFVKLLHNEKTSLIFDENDSPSQEEIIKMRTGKNNMVSVQGDQAESDISSKSQSSFDIIPRNAGTGDTKHTRKYNETESEVSSTSQSSVDVIRRNAALCDSDDSVLSDSDTYSSVNHNLISSEAADLELENFSLFTQ